MEAIRTLSAVHDAFLPKRVSSLDPREDAASHVFARRINVPAAERPSVICIDALGMPFHEIERWLFEYDVARDEWEQRNHRAATPGPFWAIFHDREVGVPESWGDHPGIDWLSDDGSLASLEDRYLELCRERAALLQRLASLPAEGSLGDPGDLVLADEGLMPREAADPGPRPYEGETAEITVRSVHGGP